MENTKQQTAVEWLWRWIMDNPEGSIEDGVKAYNQAKQMEKEQKGYTKEDIIKAGEMGEINHHDVHHIVSYLDEAKQLIETYGGNK